VSRRTKITLLALALAGLVAIPVTAAGVNALTGSAHEAAAPRQLMNGPGGPRAEMGGFEGAMRGRMGMSGQAMTVQSEFDYLTQMVPHHEEAIAAARVLLEGTDRPEMKAFAQEIIDTQSAEVAQMREWLAIWFPEQDTAISYDPMMRDLTSLSGDELDRAFLEDMIGHHMGAVMMSQHLLAGDLAEHPEVIPFAEQIRDSQHAEIFQMRAWLADWFGESAMGTMGFRR
jgi:uncharacterized protein (DUF305 family)